VNVKKQKVSTIKSILKKMGKRKSFTVTLENKEKEDEYKMFLCAGMQRK